MKRLNNPWTMLSKIPEKESCAYCRMLLTSIPAATGNESVACLSFVVY